MAIYDTTVLYSPKAPFTFDGLTGRDVWAFAYDPNPATDTLVHHCSPVRGQIVKVSKLGRKFEFWPYGRSGRLVQSKAVAAVTRCYADTEAEAYDGYNGLVMRYAARIRSLADTAANRLISPTGESPRHKLVVITPRSGVYTTVVLRVCNFDSRFAGTLRDLTTKLGKTHDGFMATVTGLKAAGYVVEILSHETVEI